MRLSNAHGSRLVAAGWCHVLRHVRIQMEAVRTVRDLSQGAACPLAFKQMAFFGSNSLGFIYHYQHPTKNTDIQPTHRDTLTHTQSGRASC